MFDFAVRPDEEGHAVDAFEFAAHKGLLAIGAEGLRDLQVRIRQEGEGQGVFLGEFGVGLSGIPADAEDDHAFGFQGGVVIPEAASFLGATWGIVFRVEVDEYGLTLEGFGGNDLSVLGFGGEGGGFGPDGQRIGLSKL